MKTCWKFEAFVSTHHKMISQSIFASNCQKLILFGRYFPTSKIPAICFFSMCTIFAKNNGIVANFDFTINDRWICYFVISGIFLFATLTVLCKNNELPKFYYVTNFYDLESFHMHLQKSQFCCLLFLNSGNMKYFVSLISRTCAHGYWSIANWGYLHHRVSKNGSLKMLLCLFGILILATLTLILLKTLWKNLF